MYKWLPSSCVHNEQVEWTDWMLVAIYLPINAHQLIVCSFSIIFINFLVGARGKIIFFNFVTIFLWYVQCSFLREGWSADYSDIIIIASDN